MFKPNKFQAIFLMLVCLFLFLAIGLFFFQNKEISYLKAVEVVQYEGQDLSSVKDFRENSIKGPQYIDRNDYRLKISGLVGDDLSYGYDEIINGLPMYKKVVTLNCIEGWSVKILWEGFLFKDLVSAEKIPASANTVIFKAYDGYSTSFPLEYLMNNDIIIAYKENDLELPPELGFPFQLVAEDKYGYKWIKWITEIEFSSDTSYQGYWESRGYPIDGNLP